MRAKVEHSLHTVKHLWGHTKVKYKGLLKNTMQFYTLFALANLYKVRKNQYLQGWIVSNWAKDPLK